MLVRLPEEMATDPVAAESVVVVAGDAVVGQALALLLRSTEYEVRSVALSHLYDPLSLETARVLLLGPGLDAEDREAVLALAWDDRRARGGIPVVELVAGGQASRPGGRHFRAPWPCRLEDLERQIDAALIAGTETDVPGEECARQDGTG